MPQPPLRSPVELLAPLIRALLFALEAQTQSPIHRLARPLMSLISHRIAAISHRFRRFAERIASGRPFPRRRAATASQPGTPRKPPPDPLPRTHGWLGGFLPAIVPHRAQLSGLLQTPEITALIEAAPAQMGRTLRPLCRMLGLKPPPILALPPRRKPVRQPRPKPPREPKWPHDPRRRDRLGHYIGPPPMLPLPPSACGPPRKKTG